MRFLFRFFSTAFVFFLFVAHASATPVNVVATIKPLHSLTAAVMDGAGEPHLLLQGNASPHGYALRPSDIAAIDRADLIVWIGPDLETFLLKSMDAVTDKGKRVLTVEDLEGINKLDFRSLSREEDDDHAAHKGKDEHAAHDDHDHAHDGVDPHLWLDIDNAKAIVNAVRDVLSERDPENAALYRSNAERTVKRLDSLNDVLKQKLGTVAAIPFVSFHDAYQYVEKAYGLSGIGSLAISPDRSPGAGHLRDVRALIKDRNVACVFQEPQFPTRTAETVIDGTGARLGILDPLGNDIADGPDLYFTLMNDLGDSLRRCLVP